MKLGSDAVDQSSAPLSVSNLSDIVSVAAGPEHSCVLSAAGHVYCWGDLAGEKAEISAIAKRIIQLPPRATQISAGALGTCALLENGDIYCWHGSIPARVPFPQDTKAIDIAVGLNQSCANTIGGSIYCWGENSVGQLGNGTNQSSDIPVEVVGVNNAQSVVASGAGVYFDFYSFSCALQSHNNGSVSCWGSNIFDQLGDGSGIDRSTPTAITGLYGIKQIASGGTHSCALFHDGYVACWGGLYGGQLGQAPLTPRAVLQ
jgi:alpha-tubulin suppressor-like RCC1 family protein